MKLSVIIVAHNMDRELPRSLLSLSESYQHDMAGIEYEILVVDNGSKNPVNMDSVSKVSQAARVISPTKLSPSPVFAVNQAAQEARGEILCLMLDGAHILTPGVFHLALAGFRAFQQPVIGTRYFFLGPDEQNISMGAGYNQQVEDSLLKQIDWPRNGYGLFDIGTPFRSGATNVSWLNRMFESNCLFVSSDLFHELNGYEESFDQPGGGFANLDFYKRACDFPNATPVQLIGEGSFHQIHGGTTTNISIDQRMAKTQEYRQQYLAIRGHDELVSDKSIYYFGHLPTEGSKIHRR